VPSETVLVWNLGFTSSTTVAVSNSRQRLLLELVKEIQPSLVALQEAWPLIRIPNYEHEVGPGRLLTAFRSDVWIKTERREYGNRAIGLGLLHRRASSEIFLWNLHLPSPLNGNSLSSRQEFVRQNFKPALEGARQSGRPDLVVGDFNLPPYDEVLMARGGFWANRCLEVAMHQARTAVLPKLPLFNPCWALLGSTSYPSGTYYRTQQADGEGPWHVIDQALMAPALARTPKQHVWLVTRVGTTELCTTGVLGTPNRAIGSDHLPLVVAFDIG
jgi:endonuclease/exonuclease/phosphatase family metal-dependent hydrolase